MVNKRNYKTKNNGAERNSITCFMTLDLNLSSEVYPLSARN